MLDMFNEIVKPAFFDSPPRKYGRNLFCLFDLSLTNYRTISGVNEPLLAGKFVRDTSLTRSHVLRDQEIVPNRAEIESATCARFVIVLSSHTLLYVPETPHAPPLGMFKSTIQYHLIRSWRNHINLVTKHLKTLPDNKAKKTAAIREALTQETPRPELKIVELPSSISIADFLDKFKTVDRVEFRINDTNHSASLKPVLDQLRAEKEATKAASITIVESAPKDITQLKKQLTSATSDGNVEATLNGKGHSGEKIRGSNEHFRLSIPLGESLPTQMKQFVENVFSVFSTLKTKKEIVVHSAKGEAEKKLQKISSSIN